MKFSQWLVLASLLFSSYASAQQDQLSYPTEDAKEHYQQGKVEFVGIQLDDEMLVPGLRPAQLEIVDKQYKVVALNRRWKTFANIEKQPKRFERMRRYAVRYNMMLWKLAHSPQSDRFKYRY